jgi:carbamate kinase
MGYMIEQCLQNILLRRGLKREVLTVITQVFVDPYDPALVNPTKFIGQYYGEEDAQRLAKSEGWSVKRDGDRGWRRVVGSPQPLAILNAEPIAHLVDHGTIVIAAGGGGIPVYAESNGWLEGVDAVIDKDRASAVLARDIAAKELFILTEPEQVALNYGKPNERSLSRLSVSEARQYYAEGHFPPGSMGPKIEAAITFLESGGERVLICALSKFVESLDGRSGTAIVPD